MNETKRQIAETFERRMIEDGYSQTTLDAIARELHISKKTIYVHFQDKRDIYACIVKDQAARDKARIAAAVADRPGPSAQTTAVLSMVLEAARSHIQATDREEWLREYDVAAEAFTQAYGELLAELFEAGVATGEFSPGDPAFVTRMVSAMLLDYVVALRDDPTLDFDEQLVERIMMFLGRK